MKANRPSPAKRPFSRLRPSLAVFARIAYPLALILQVLLGAALFGRASRPFNDAVPTLCGDGECLARVDLQLKGTSATPTTTGDTTG